MLCWLRIPLLQRRVFYIYPTMKHSYLTDMTTNIALEKVALASIVFCSDPAYWKKEYQLPSVLAFVDYEKAFNRADRNKLWNVMMDRGVRHHLIRAVQSRHHETPIIVERKGKIYGFFYASRCKRMAPTVTHLVQSTCRHSHMKMELKDKFYMNNTECTCDALHFSDDQVI
jgi:hypothetical protein